MLTTALITVWVGGWVFATVFAAYVIGMAENYPGEKEPSFPAFMFPLFFGWTWPAVAALALVIAPFALLVRLGERHRKPAAQSPERDR